MMITLTVKISMGTWVLSTLYTKRKSNATIFHFSWWVARTSRVTHPQGPVHEKKHNAITILEIGRVISRGTYSSLEQPVHEKECTSNTTISHLSPDDEIGRVIPGSCATCTHKETCLSLSLMIRLAVIWWTVKICRIHHLQDPVHKETCWNHEQYICDMMRVISKGIYTCVLSSLYTKS